MNVYFHQGMPLYHYEKSPGCCASNIPAIWGIFIQTLLGKSLTEHEGKDNIYLENSGMGSIYVTTPFFVIKIGNLGKLSGCQELSLWKTHLGPSLGG